MEEEGLRAEKSQPCFDCRRVLAARRARAEMASARTTPDEGSSGEDCSRQGLERGRRDLGSAEEGSREDCGGEDYSSRGLRSVEGFDRGRHDLG